MSDDAITFWQITHNPSDFPGKYVVRAHYVERGRGTPRPSHVCMVFETLEEARAVVPPGCWRFPRMAEDDPVIVESWMQ